MDEEPRTATATEFEFSVALRPQKSQGFILDGEPRKATSTEFEFSVALRPLKQQGFIMDGEPRTATSISTQLLSSVPYVVIVSYGDLSNAVNS